MMPSFDISNLAAQSSYRRVQPLQITFSQLTLEMKAGTQTSAPAFLFTRRMREILLSSFKSKPD